LKTGGKTWNPGGGGGGLTWLRLRAAWGWSGLGLGLRRLCSRAWGCGLRWCRGRLSGRGLSRRRLLCWTLFDDAPYDHGAYDERCGNHP
jgi:hypothetical protein